jgi:hypothetical protein
MRYPSTNTVYRRVIENPRLAQRTRMAALEAIARPSLRLLMRLLKNPATPPRLLALAAKKYEVEMTRKELRARARQRTTQAAHADCQ